jgi:hypothetical protein
LILDTDIGTGAKILQMPQKAADMTTASIGHLHKHFIFITPV